MYNRHEMVELVTINGKARGIIARNLETGKLERHSYYAVVMFMEDMEMYSLSTTMGPIIVVGKFTKRCLNPVIHRYIQHVYQEVGHQSKLTRMSESLRNDGEFENKTEDVTN